MACVEVLHKITLSLVVPLARRRRLCVSVYA